MGRFRYTFCESSIRIKKLSVLLCAILLIAGVVSSINATPHIKPLDLSEQDIWDLVAFLSALTDPVFVNRPNIP